MMRGTPRAFIGPTLFILDGQVCIHIADAVRAKIAAMPGISACEFDIPAGLLIVTAQSPVDRTDVLGVLRSSGCPVQS